MDPVMVEHHVDKRWLRISSNYLQNPLFNNGIYYLWHNSMASSDHTSSVEEKCSPMKLTLPAKHINRLQLNQLILILIILGDHDNRDLREW